MQISRGKYDRLPRTTAGFTAYAFDGYGLRDQTLARPALVPLIRFLFIGSRICSALPSNTVSHWCSCAPLPFTSIRLGEDFHFQAVTHCSAHVMYHPHSGGHKVPFGVSCSIHARIRGTSCLMFAIAVGCAPLHPVSSTSDKGLICKLRRLVPRKTLFYR